MAKTPSKAVPKTAAQWRIFAARELSVFLALAQKTPELRKRGPKDKKAEWQLGLEFLDFDAMAKLNLEYRQKAHPTDILSFPAPEVFRSAGYLGDLVICLPVMKRQAWELEHNPVHELKVLLVHGLLHLLGYDHEKKGPKGKKEALEMARWEDKLLASERGLIRRSLK